MADSDPKKGQTILEKFKLTFHQRLYTIPFLLLQAYKHFQHIKPCFKSPEEK
jgi:hypothetical protein